jgi:hypothetical protein
MTWPPGAQVHRDGVGKRRDGGTSAGSSPAASTVLAETEKGFLEAIVHLAGLRGWEMYHTHDSRHSAAGFPDLVMVRPPRIIFAEVKTATGRLTRSQNHWIALLLGCPLSEVYLWRPKDWPAIERALAR